MKLPIPGLPKKSQAEYYLALVLKNERATSVLFSKTGNTIKYLGHGEEDFENTIEDATTEQFIEVLDKSITQAENVLPDNIETHKTIFGLKEIDLYFFLFANFGNPLPLKNRLYAKSNRLITSCKELAGTSLTQSMSLMVVSCFINSNL